MTQIKTDLAYQKIEQIQKLSNDALRLQEFLSDLDKYKTEKISKMFIVTDQKHCIELIGHFTPAASNSLFDLIIKSRSKILIELNQILKDFLNTPGTGKTIKPD